ncbi:MAG TPA: histidine kinase dimerization/phospho-acceptor domain-containing protein [Gaiellaceae bacterium]|nr:histidine kinase dimerization/phospho-acceptor domain-containing protein [Gaiellaceae bacterium]
MASQPFPRLVSLACHDLRTPLATVYGFARTLTRTGDLDERSQRFIGMIEEASEQMTDLLDLLGVAARIAGKRWEPALRDADTLELVTFDDERIAVSGEGETIETEPDTLAIALRALAIAAARYGPADQVAWEARGRQLALSPLLPEARAVVMGEEPRDLGSLVARMVIEELGGSLTLEGERLIVAL